MGQYGKAETDATIRIDCSKGGPSLTKQQFADECDINKIVARFEKTGMLDHLNKREPFYGDVSELRSYQDALQVVQEAEELFAGLDANVRSRFDNDPAKLISFLDDRKNLDEAVRLGIVLPKPEVKNEPVPPVVPPAPPKA